MIRALYACCYLLAWTGLAEVVEVPHATPSDAPEGGGR